MLHYLMSDLWWLHMVMSRYPVESIATMRAIISAAEHWSRRHPLIVHSLFERVSNVSGSYHHHQLY